MTRPYTLVALAALLWSAGNAFAAEPAPAKRQPNVILILADDLGYGDLSCYGTGKLKTPNIDRLASEGLRFTDGYAPASTCTPTRYGIISGEYAWRKKGTGILPGDAALIISPTRNTLPRIFQKAGYATGAIGKWHLGLGSGAPDFNGLITPGLNELGFDYSFNMAATGDRVPCVYMENGRVVNLEKEDPISVSYTKPIGDLPTYKDHPELLKMKSLAGHNNTIINGIGRIGYMSGGKKAIWDDQTLSDTFNGKALEFIRKNKAKPFFLYYASHEPHVPRDPNPRFVGKSGLGARGDAILQLDDQVANILRTLKEENIDDDTLIIFSSDNGPAVQDGYADGALATENKAGHKAAGTLKGGKYTNFEGGTREPFLARWPGHIRAGVTSAEPVSLIDMAGTAAAITGQKLAPGDAPDSFDMLPVLTAGAKSVHPYLLFGNPVARPEASGIREGKWKLIVAPGRPAKVEAEEPADVNVAAAAKKAAGKGAELFDLEKDPSETTNVAAEHPDVVKRLTEIVVKAGRDGYTRPGAAKVDIR